MVSLGRERNLAQRSVKALLTLAADGKVPPAAFLVCPLPPTAERIWHM